MQISVRGKGITGSAERQTLLLSRERCQPRESDTPSVFRRDASEGLFYTGEMICWAYFDSIDESIVPTLIEPLDVLDKSVTISSDVSPHPGRSNNTYLIPEMKMRDNNDSNSTEMFPFQAPAHRDRTSTPVCKSKNLPTPTAGLGHLGEASQDLQHATH